MSYLLAANTSQSSAELALFKDSQFIGNQTWEKEKSHSEVITEAFQDLLTKHNLNQNQIDEYACVVGPGSFTGLRVGVNFIKTLAFSFNKACFAINSLDLIMASNHFDRGSAITVMDAQKNSVFISKFTKNGLKLCCSFNNKVIEIIDLNKVIDEPTFVFGDGFENYSPFLPKDIKKNLMFEKSNAVSLINLFNEPTLHALNQKLSWFELQPLYIKASAPEEKLNPTIF